ncbi:translation initiation factor IF-2 [Emticicia sp. 21SJ11W-3]|uniref:translation initiation factor IF-2 n=1 Tax=Emticicia sp. 21SJ11W-3 TaxID=2916755 RepID=UPI00209ECBC3|nr:translation initiation factor IF-2 [Emticicia sp. 21SJ11W-3]UTA69851.1 translation initiation factor IF-2 [Emticicia sp. 21SJ11W-3]
MIEQKEMRISLAAKKLNVGIATIVEKLANKGHRIDNNPNAKLNFEQLNILSKEFSNSSLLEESVAAKPVEDSKPASGNTDILYFRDQPKGDEKKADNTPEPAPVKEVETIRAEQKLQGPVILGKIDLDRKPSAPVTPEPQKTEPAAEEKPKAEVVPVAETKEVAEKPAAAPPKVEDKPVQAPEAKEESPKAVELPKAEARPAEVAKEPTPAPQDVQNKDNQPKREYPQGRNNPQDRDNTHGRPNQDRPGQERPGQDRPAQDRSGQDRPGNWNQNRPGQERPGQDRPGQDRPGQDRQGQGNRDQNRGPRPQQSGQGGYQQNRPAAEQRPQQGQPLNKKPAAAPAPKEEEVEPELIQARGEKLQGLKVLGKIELPVEKKSTPGSAEDRDAKRKRKRKRVKRAEKVDSADSAARPKVPGAPVAAGAAAAAKKGTDPKKKKERREEVSQTEVKEQIKQTMARMQTKGPDFGAKYRKDKRKMRAEQEEQRIAQEQEDSNILKVTEFISASELASMMDVSITEVISAAMKMGMFVSINQRLDAEAIQMLALDFDFDVQFISAEEEVQSDVIDKDANLQDIDPRAPIVTIMGHVDHGKTSLLDYIRRARVAAGEAGGITQHIGAYSVEMKDGPNKGKKITFLDTPGHEAFTAMRARGAKVTDVVIVVVAADDSVMPQTREAINHAQNAGVPIVFAINKIDKPGANPAKIREDLAKENILVESWGGKYQEQEVSAKQGTGISDLLDKVLLEAELLELKANQERSAIGTVIEASLDKGRGYVATILVQNGKLKVGDIILAGQYFGRVRAMVDDLGVKIKEAGPSTPVQILGLPGAPQAGDKFNVMESEREAREIANKREQIIREQSLRARKHITLEEIGRRKAIGAFHQLNVIVKGDVDGSVEALSDSLLKLSTEEVQVSIIHKGVGQISESDVNLASTADAIIIGFQVRPSNNARKIADQEEIEIRLYSIIYDAINEIKDAMEGLLAPKEEETIVGSVEVREIFKISKVGTIAGCYVTDGSIKRNNKVRVIREGIVIHEGEISQLKRFKDDVNEVKTNFECGLSVKGFNDIEVGDTIESFEIKEVKRTL